ncbi:hypothetical protein [Gottfriedia luciferensis]|uniref:hypothetical protein n=1 Tax=Gottfriedia luciferensis TaxID=178774 RepID=UPI000B4481D4|nr:hypothetical protein [Gottfriedia luciferensis]
MYKQISLVIFIFIFIFLIGCTNNLSLRDEFNETMKKEKNVQKYTILSEDIQSNTGTIFYQYKLKENGLGRGQLISLSVFNKQDDKWKLMFSGGCNDKWNISSSENEKENIYCGTINDPIYTNVLIGDIKAKIIKLKNSNLKAWFYLNSNPYLSITAERVDGKKEIWQPASK